MATAPRRRRACRTRPNNAFRSRAERRRATVAAVLERLASSLRCIIVASCTALAVAPLAAQEYPNRPIRVIVPFSPGGAVDGPTRMVAQELTKRLNQQVVVDNRPGAGATIGSEAVAKAAPDGYTLLLASQTNAISATLYPKLSFNPIDDFAPISLIGREPGVLVVHPSLPAKTVQELIEGTFLAYNAARLREACQLFTQKMLDPDVDTFAEMGRFLLPVVQKLGLGQGAAAIGG